MNALIHCLWRWQRRSSKRIDEKIAWRRCIDCSTKSWNRSRMIASLDGVESILNRAWIVATTCASSSSKMCGVACLMSDGDSKICCVDDLICSCAGETRNVFDVNFPFLSNPRWISSRCRRTLRLLRFLQLHLARLILLLLLLLLSKILSERRLLLDSIQISTKRRMLLSLMELRKLQQIWKGW